MFERGQDTSAGGTGGFGARQQGYGVAKDSTKLKARAHEASASIKLRLLSTTDVHGYLTSHDYFSDVPDPTVGLTRTATLIAAARREATNCLLFDSGDFLQGCAITDLAALEDRTGLHPVIDAMNRLDYDAAALGNHDFNYGLEILGKALAEARFPVLCANIFATGLKVDGTVLLDRTVKDDQGKKHRLTIGVFGITPPQTVSWDRQILPDDVEAQDLVPAAKAQIAALQEAGADLVVGLCHTGVAGQGVYSEQEHAALPISALEGIDVVLAGHSHQIYPDPAIERPETSDAAPPVLIAGSWGAWLGVVDLTLDRSDGRWHITGSSSALRSVATPDGPVSEDQSLAEHLRPVHDATRAFIRRPVGHTETPLHSYFAQVGACQANRVVAEAKLDYLKRSLAASAGSADWDLPMIAATSAFKAGKTDNPHFYTDIPPGPLTLRSVADLYLYPNAFCAVRASGAELTQWLEQSAAQFHRIEPGARDAVLLDPDFPSHGFDILHGLTYAFDLSSPARFSADGRVIDPTARRVLDLRYKGRPVKADDHFIVATNAYRSGGGGGYPVCSPERIVHTTTDRVRDIVRDHLSVVSPDRTAAPQVFRFKPLGATALLVTGQGARAHLDEAVELGLDLVGEAKGGFLHFRLTL